MSLVVLHFKLCIRIHVLCSHL